MKTGSARVIQATERFESVNMDCQPLSIELKDRQENASFCIGVCPIPSFEVGYVAARRQVNHVVTRPSVISFHGRLDKGTTSEHRREVRAQNIQLLEERNHEERIKSSHVSEDIDSDSQAKEKASFPGTKHTTFIYSIYRHNLLFGSILAN